ncbi:MAG: hypothetical protein JST70_13945 [Bacteroidetes bacterium]|nr:hypothetical protein [Bacteroidota bacterium]
MKRRICLSLVICLFFRQGFGQNHDLSFTNGRLAIPQNKAFETIKKADKVTIIFTDNALTEADKKEIRTALVSKLDRTIRNLEDPSMNLEALYKTIWGAAFYDSYLKALKSFQKSLAENTAIARYAYLPDQAAIDHLLKTTSLYAEAKPPQDNDVLKERRILYTDPYKDWVVTLYNDDKGSKDLVVDADYIKGWRELEAVYKDLSTVLDSLRKKINHSTACDAEIAWRNDVLKRWTNLTASASKNRILVLLRTDFYKRWLWYTEGIPVMNPFFVTSPGKEFPSSEKDVRFYWSDPAIKLTDSLNRLQTTDLLNIVSTKNLVRLPVYSDDDKIALWHFDASDNYSTYDLNGKKKRLSNEKRVEILLHNLPAEKSAKYSEKVVSVSEYGTGISQFNTAVSQTATFIGNMTGLAGPLGKLFSLFEPSQPGISPTSITAPTKKARVGSDAALTESWKGVAKMNYVALEKVYDVDDLNLDHNKDEPEKPHEYFEKDGFIYYLSSNWKLDKPLILYQYIQYYDFTLPDSMIKSFLIHNKYNNIVNYYNDLAIEKAIDKLFTDFATYYNAVSACNTKYTTAAKDLEPTTKLAGQLISIPTRNLPPTILKAKTSEVPQMRTEIFDVKSDADNEVTFTIAEKKKEGDSVIAYKGKLRFGKWISFDVSAGLGFTWSDYINNVLADKSKVTDVTTRNDRFHGIAGLHWYPTKIYKAESTFFIGHGLGTFMHRVSLFAGIDIIYPRFNFYPGVSFDVIPGLKLIVGLQLYRNTKYEILNNAVVNDASGLKVAGFYTSLNIDSKVFTKAFTKQ